MLSAGCLAFAIVSTLAICSRHHDHNDNGHGGDSEPSRRSRLVARQLAKVSANQSISDGRAFSQQRRIMTMPPKRFQFALDSLSSWQVLPRQFLPSRGGRSGLRPRPARRKNLAKDNKYAPSRDSLLQQAVILQPDNPVYPADIERIEAGAGRLRTRSSRSRRHDEVNPAVTDEFKATRGYGAEASLFQGDAYFSHRPVSTRPRKLTPRALILDPYNKAARDKMAHIERYRERADGFRHEQYEQARRWRMS